jgi:arylsulfatase I/J
VIAKKLKQGGYATHYAGKWDAGFATQYHIPINRGFDTGFGYFQHANNYWQFTDGGCKPADKDLWNSTKPAKEDVNEAYCNQANQTGCTYEDDLIVSNVLAEIEAHNPSTPLFFYYAPHNIHAPLQVPQKYIDSSIGNRARRLYSAMVHHMDDMVGLVIAKLKEKGLWNNTLLVMSSDNGGPVHSGGGANNYPLKGGKTSNWEGGIRVNALVSGGYLPENVRGTKSEDFVAISDWYATFCALAGVDPVDDAALEANLPPVDSFDLWPLLTRTNTTNPRTEIPIGFDNGGHGNNVVVQGIIVPPYKLLQGVVGTSFWQGPLYPNSTTNYTYQSELHTNCGSGCLFHLLDDPTEHNDISKANPSIVSTLSTRIAEIQKTVFNADRGAVDTTAACEHAEKVYGGFFGPWITPTFRSTQHYQKRSSRTPMNIL